MFALWAVAVGGGLFFGGYAYGFVAGTLGLLLFYAVLNYATAGRGITISVQPSRSYLTAGDCAEVEIRLTRKAALLPLTWLAVCDCWKDANGVDTYRCTRLFFPGFKGEMVYRYAIGSIERGRYGNHRVELTTGDAFGLLERSHTWQSEPSTNLIVVPRPLYRSDVALGGQGLPLRSDRRSGYGDKQERTATVRNYRPGDPLRHIHWKASAHSGEWKSVELESESATCPMVFVDLAGSATERGLFEAVLQVACGQLTAWAKQGLRLRLVTGVGGKRRSRETGPHDLRELLVELAALSPAADTDSRFAPQVVQACRELSGPLLVVTAAPDAALLDACGQLAQTGQTVEVCHLLPLATSLSAAELWSSRFAAVRCRYQAVQVAQPAALEVERHGASA
jgi:uncharacterized protein (DUF58 family)